MTGKRKVTTPSKAVQKKQLDAAPKGEWITHNGGKLKPFRKGKTGGRVAGTPNKHTRILKEAILMAAEAVGENGKGKDKLVGYLKWIARREPASFCTLLGKILPLQIVGANDGPVRVKYETPEQVADALKRRGIPETAIGSIMGSVFGENATDGLAAINASASRH